jgi:hypothetical protein
MVCLALKGYFPRVICIGHLPHFRLPRTLYAMFAPRTKDKEFAPKGKPAHRVPANAKQ